LFANVVRITCSVTLLATLGAGDARACVPQPIVYLRPVSSGPPGTEVTVEGQNFTAGRAEVRWNGFDGQILATPTGPTFSSAVSIPDVDPGLYTVLVLVRDPAGAIGAVARSAFQVTSRAGISPSSGQPAIGITPERAGSERWHAGAVAGGTGLLVGAGLGVVFARRRRGKDGGSRKGGSDNNK
jgi:hypothetical protein